jgi:predicted metal-binding membrane protein
MVAAAGTMSIVWMLLMTLVVFAKKGVQIAQAIERRRQQAK